MKEKRCPKCRRRFKTQGEYCSYCLSIHKPGQASVIGTYYNKEQEAIKYCKKGFGILACGNGALVVASKILERL